MKCEQGQAGLEPGQGASGGFGSGMSVFAGIQGGLGW